MRLRGKQLYTLTHLLAQAVLVAPSSLLCQRLHTPAPGALTMLPCV